MQGGMRSQLCRQRLDVFTRTSSLPGVKRHAGGWMGRSRERAIRRRECPRATAARRGRTPSSCCGATPAVHLRAYRSEKTAASGRGDPPSGRCATVRPQRRGVRFGSVSRSPRAGPHGGGGRQRDRRSSVHRFELRLRWLAHVVLEIPSSPHAPAELLTWV